MIRCSVCDKSDWHIFNKDFTEWENTFGLCKNCGFLCYHVNPEEESKIREYYRKDYRSVPIGPTNLTTTSRKLNYIRVFIEDWLKEKEEKQQQLIVGDIGCATGYIVDWFRRRGHKATGSEWTISMRRFANHFYGIPITEDINEKHKYDFLMMYHTFEHMIEPDKKLEKYRSLLKDDGVMMIATPQWLDKLDEASGRISTFHDLYPKDHCNVYSETSLKNLFIKAGLEIIKEDHITYGQTYLLKKCEPKPDAIVKENWKDIVKILEDQKKAIEIYRNALKTGNDLLFREALKIVPKFPEAYYDWILNSQQKKDRGRCAELIEEALKVMPNDVKVRAIRAFFLYQNENWAGALDDFDYLCRTKVNEEFLMFKGMCLYHLGRLSEAMNAFNDASLLNPEKWTEAMVWICKCAREQKAWDEVAIDKLKDQMFNKANIEILPNDPVFKENGESENVPRATDSLIKPGNPVEAK